MARPSSAAEIIATMALTSSSSTKNNHFPGLTKAFTAREGFCGGAKTRCSLAVGVFYQMMTVILGVHRAMWARSRFEDEQASQPAYLLKPPFLRISMSVHGLDFGYPVHPSPKPITSIILLGLRTASPIPEFLFQCYSRAVMYSPPARQNRGVSKFGTEDRLQQSRWFTVNWVVSLESECGVPDHEAGPVPAPVRCYGW